MTDPTRSILRLGFLAAIFMTLLYLLPAVSGWLGGDGVSLADLLKQIAKIQQQRAALDRARDVLLFRTAEKERVIQQLRTGRLTLLEAAAKFKSLNESPEDCPSESYKLYAGSSDGERICLQVISWAHAQAAMTSPGEADAVARRLEAELQHHLQREGVLYLPDD